MHSFNMDVEGADHSRERDLWVGILRQMNHDASYSIYHSELLNALSSQWFEEICEHADFHPDRLRKILKAKILKVSQDRWENAHDA